MDPAFFTVRTPRARTQQQLQAARMHSSCFQRSRGFKNRMAHPACMNRHACWLLLLLLLAGAGCCCCWLLLVAAQQQPAAAASATSSSQQQPAPARELQQPAAASMGMAAAWLLHGHAAWAWLLHGHATASKPGCMVHGMLLLQNRDAWCMACRFNSSCCCVLACVRAWPPS